MFQPSPVPKLIPKLIQAKVPVWLVATIIAVDILAIQLGQPNDPSCDLIHQLPHYSTSVQESLRVNAIKFNITSSCTENQIYTELMATISSVSGGKQNVLLTSDLVRQDASKKDRTKAYFLEFWVPCKYGTFTNYLLRSEGSVLLQSGRNISVSKSIDKPLSILCKPKAK